ncbi:uncharacterized protein LOC118405283 [Branchiostoma floridae]|uniref:1-alkyl-2-acetylglycerophosphocholine esterase n=1 Tax=Branchiostoma floridae TaxID=7739 RepID=A0A9J7HMG5_BRAFL|nr:uncharacterized protein LOC118405283 [Branchiostoma floridae]
MKDSAPPHQPAIVVIIAGTNNLHSTTTLQEDLEEFAHILRTAKAQFPMSKVAAVGIMPRLDQEVDHYNQQFRGICDVEEVNFFDYTTEFPQTQLRLWSRHDSLHLSEDAGLPRLLRLLERSCSSLLTSLPVSPIQRLHRVSNSETETPFVGAKGHAYCLDPRHAGLYKAKLWKKSAPAASSCKQHTRRLTRKRSKTKRKVRHTLNVIATRSLDALSSTNCIVKFSI